MGKVAKKKTGSKGVQLDLPFDAARLERFRHELRPDLSEPAARSSGAKPARARAAAGGCPETVTVRMRSSVIDERTGEPFRWHTSGDRPWAEAYVRKINAGKMRDPDGKPWPPVEAWIE
jgi:hypothetical protein